MKMDFYWETDEQYRVQSQEIVLWMLGRIILIAFLAEQFKFYAQAYFSHKQVADKKVPYDLN